MQIGRKIPIAIERYLLSGAIFASVIILYAPLIFHWYDGWLNKNISIEHEYFSHGLIGLPFAAHISWTHRHQWRKLPDSSYPFGAFLLLLAGVLYLSGVPNAVNLSFPVILAGLCLWLKGIPGLKHQSFPLLLVFLATPTAVPYLLAPYTMPLQQFIAGAAGFILTQVGLNVTVEQIYLFVNGRIVEVAPFCAGLKMLFTSLYVTLMLLYWTGVGMSRTKSILLLVGAVIISVIGNIIRNSLLSFFHGTGQEQAFAWLHEGWGGDVYSACMLGVIVLLLLAIEKYDLDAPQKGRRGSMKTASLVRCQVSKVAVLCFMLVLIAIAAIPGYLTGWLWAQPFPVATLKQLKNLSKTGVVLPNWQIKEQRQENIGGHQWSYQELQRDDQKPITLLLLPQKSHKAQPEVEWMDIQGYGRWKTDSDRSLQFTAETSSSPKASNTQNSEGGNKQIAKVETHFFRAWSDRQTFAVLQWYAFPNGGNPAPSHWFFIDQLAQWHRHRVPWVAVSIHIPIQPLGDIETARNLAQSLGQMVQTALMAESLLISH